MGPHTPWPAEEGRQVGGGVGELEVLRRGGGFKGHTSNTRPSYQQQQSIAQTS
jgi:hypothetical protein